MKIAPRQIANFLTKPPAEIVAVLFHGNDLGMISERAKQFAHLFNNNLDDIFSVTRLTGDMLSGEAGHRKYIIKIVAEKMGKLFGAFANHAQVITVKQNSSNFGWWLS